MKAVTSLLVSALVSSFLMGCAGQSSEQASAVKADTQSAESITPELLHKARLNFDGQLEELNLAPRGYVGSGEGMCDDRWSAWALGMATTAEFREPTPHIMVNFATDADLKEFAKQVYLLGDTFKAYVGQNASGEAQFLEVPLCGFSLEGATISVGSN